MAKQAINIRLFSLEQIPHPGASLQKANARPWEQVQLRMPDKRPGGGATMELIETLVISALNFNKDNFGNRVFGTNWAIDT
jgi:hypothetical protein